MESNSENLSQNESHSQQETSTGEKSGDLVCSSCGRAISQTTKKCYYCSEADPEDIKNLNFIMLDWQRQEASDPELRATEKSKKILSLFQIIMASTCFALGFVPDFIPFQSNLLYFMFGILAAISSWCFYFNSLTLIFSALVNTSCMIFFLNLAFKGLPQLIIPAFVCGFIASLSAFTLFLITVRIYKNKAVEI